MSQVDIESGDAAAPSRFETVEIELALDLQEPSGETFETRVRNAVAVVGGEVLFDVPADGSLDDASRIAAVRVPGSPRDRIVFAILNETETSIRVAEPDEVGDRLYGFAEAFVGVLTRIRDDMRLAGLASGGTA
ncbi:hypothetical protein [Aureimonas leprariae]|uniref:Uncharacterized protein n=1 Tax=Plantimonas leprariae TaxID=2615207 RepID=A0A7V7PP27_9HYPH|nr:hypothetical protein [Aureimonas leprariae]KAB0679557.1 hypothetical protein F6X38_12085 [Aureimonas leprariae]